MEYFEIAIFPEKNENNERKVQKIKESLTRQTESFVKVSEYDDKEFDKIRFEFPKSNEENEFKVQQIEEFIEKKEGLVVEFFQYDDREFDEVYICIPNFKFHKENLKMDILQLINFVSILFENFPKSKFVTGIYEITFDYVEGLLKFEDFDKNFIAKFPLVFWEKEFFDEEVGTVIYSNDNIICTYNEKGQKII